MPQANVGDLALLEEAVADDVLSAFLLAALDQTDHGVDVGKVVPRLRDLGLVGGDEPFAKMVANGGTATSPSCESS